MNIAEIRAQFPQYSDMSDLALVMGLHGKFYSEMPLHDFVRQLDGGQMIYATSKDKAAQAAYEAAVSQPMPGETPDATAARTGGTSSGPVGNPGGQVGTAARSVLQGLTFGAGDELVAAGAGALDPNHTYTDYLKAERDRLALGRDQFPKTAIGGELAGAIMSPANQAVAGLVGKTIPVATSVTGIPTLMGKAVTGAAEGVAGGGLYGFNAGEGGLPDRATSAAITGAAGGLIGGATPFAIAGASKLADTVAGGPLSSLLPFASPVRASRAIDTAVRRSGMTPDDVAAAIAAARNEGQAGFTVADALGNAGQRMLSGTVRQPGDARQAAVDMLMQRQADQGDRIGGFLADALGAQATAKASGAAMKATRDAAANAEYSAARAGAGPVDVRGVVAAIDDRIGPMNGSGISGDGIDGRMAYYRSRLAAGNPEATKFAPASSVELSDFTRVLNVKKDITDEIGAAVRAGKNNLARELGALKDQLDGALEAASGGYRTANDNFARASKVLDTIDTGAGMASSRVRAPDALAAFSGMTPEQQAAARIGYGDQLIGKVEAAREGANKAAPLMTGKNSAQLNAMALNPDMLGRQIGREKTMFETAAEALGGSKTAQNLADQKDAAGFSANMLVNILAGRFGTAGTQALQGVLNTAQGKNEATRALIIKALLGQDIQGALRPAIEAAKNTPVRDALNAIITRAGIVGASRVGQ